MSEKKTKSIFLSKTVISGAIGLIAVFLSLDLSELQQAELTQAVIAVASFAGVVYGRTVAKTGVTLTGKE